MSKLTLAFIALFCLPAWLTLSSQPSLITQASAGSLQATNGYDADLELAQRFVPVFYFHPDEIYLPQPVEVALSVARLRQSRKAWFDTNILNNPTLQDLFANPCDETCFLDQWFGDSGSSEYTNYSAHEAIYNASLNPQTGGQAPVIYAHVVRDENPDHITIQYWIFYFYNHWFNVHEGDWEMVELILSASGLPEWAIYSQHHGGTRRSWDTTPLEDGTHPMVFVARGSHANYFFGDENYPHGQDVGNERVDIIDRTGFSNRLVPEVILIPTRAELVAEPGAYPGTEWLMYRGRWGENAPQGDFSGPYGPADKGIQWEQPLAWGLSQPLDVETWYKNRLQVEVARPEQGEDRVCLADENGQTLPDVECVGSRAILHADPPAKVIVQVQGVPGTRWGMDISWPDKASGKVIQQSLLSFEVDTSGQAQLAISSGPGASQPVDQAVATPEPESPSLPLQVAALSAANRFTLQASAVETYLATWDAPDLVWVANLLPFQDILGGSVIALLYSLLPTMLFVMILHWCNRYRREPPRMLAIAFVWGAIPALVVSLLLELFLKLPINQMGTNALEAIRLGMLAPVLEEILKAAGVLIIFRRHPKEVSDVLDGMVYGAMVGFGFAMTANLLRYVGAFLVWGYTALDAAQVAERTVHALDHGLFTAIFGAWVGFAQMAQTPRQFRARIAGGLILAIATHAVRNLLANSLVGLNVFTVLVTCAGTLVLWAIGGWSLVKQRQLMVKELQGVIHDSLYQSVLDPIKRSRTQWDTFRREGVGAWMRVRRLQGLCIKLAQTRLQARLFPEKTHCQAQAEHLVREINGIFDEMRPAVG